MKDKKTKSSLKLHPGRRKTHGGYAFLTKGTLPENKPYIERYLTVARESLIRDLGPTEQDLTAAQIIIIDRIVSKLGVIRCIEEHIKENAVMVGQELAPALRASYLAYNNSVRLDLRELGIDKRVGDRVLTPLEIAERIDQEEEKAKEKKK